MRRVLWIMVACLVAVLAADSIAAQPPAPTAESWNQRTPQPTPAPPFVGLGKFTRAERKLAKEAIQDAAQACGMRRMEFCRAVNEGNAGCVEELKVSLATHEDVSEIDIERLREILQMILDFIKQLMAIFGMFADNAQGPALEVATVPLYSMAA